MEKGLTIICKNCGNTIDVFDGMRVWSKKFSFWPIQSERINIRCECDNEVFIEEG